jgi:2-amino-4-hydroxy-6-hydroxymethyldihydropteridine diphosphokinase
MKSARNLEKRRPEETKTDAPATVYIALGTNLGNRLAALKNALIRIAALPQTQLCQRSPVYETLPESASNNLYLNMVVAVQTLCAPHDLLDSLLAIEHKLGRRRSGQKNEDRLIDLDLLLYDGLICDTKKLTLPHPRMHRREFVLQPLDDLAPNLMHPVLKKPIHTLRKALGPPTARRVYTFPPIESTAPCARFNPDAR